MFIFTINLEYFWTIFSNEICSRSKCRGELDTINLKDKKFVYSKVLVFYRQEYSTLSFTRILLLLTFTLSF